MTDPSKTITVYPYTKLNGVKVEESEKPASRKGSVADRVIQLRKVNQEQHGLPRVKLGDKFLENVYSFVYLGSEIAGDGDPLVPVKHITNIVWGRFVD